MIRHPLAPEGAVTIATIRNGGAATSYFGSRPTRLACAGLVDGRSGNPIHAGLVTVLAPDCMTADAMTKVAGLLGETADTVLAQYGAEAVWHPQPDHFELRQST